MEWIQVNNEFNDKKKYGSWQHFEITIHTRFLKLHICCDRPQQ